MAAFVVDDSTASATGVVLGVDGGGKGCHGGGREDSRLGIHD